MNRNSKNIKYCVSNGAICAFFAGKLLDFGKCACVKDLTIIMSEPERLLLTFGTILAQIALVYYYRQAIPAWWRVPQIEAQKSLL